VHERVEPAPTTTPATREAASPGRSESDASDVLGLQRLAGNRIVGQLLAGAPPEAPARGSPARAVLRGPSARDPGSPSVRRRLSEARPDAEVVNETGQHFTFVGTETQGSETLYRLRPRGGGTEVLVYPGIASYSYVEAPPVPLAVSTTPSVLSIPDPGGSTAPSSPTSVAVPSTTGAPSGPPVRRVLSASEFTLLVSVDEGTLDKGSKLQGPTS
jgi:hypothetical protein